MRDFIAVMFLLASVVVLVLSVIALIKPIPKLKLPTRKSALKGIALAVGLFVATLIAIPKDASPDADAPAENAKAENHIGTVAASNSKIAEVRVTEETKFASVKIDLGEIWSEANLPTHAALVVEDVGKAIKKGASDIPAEIETINFWFTGPTIDNYGNEGRGSLLQFRMKIEDLKMVNYGKISAQSLLEFAYDIEIRVRARAGVAQYCVKHNATTNPKFCAVAE